MNADEAHQQELENRRREEELWARHRDLVLELGRECRAFYEKVTRKQSREPDGL